MTTKSRSTGWSTKAIHAGEESLPKTGPLIPPIYQNSTFQFETAEECVNAFMDEDSGYVYTRWGNPTQSVLESKIAVLECGEAALATASGMAAVSTALLTLLAQRRPCCSDGFSLFWLIQYPERRSPSHGC